MNTKALVGSLLGGLMFAVLIGFLVGAADSPRPVSGVTPRFSIGPTDINSAGLADIGTEYVLRDGPTAGTRFRIQVGVTGGDSGGFAILLLDCPEIEGCEWYTYLSGTDFDTATANMTFASATGPHEVTSGGFAQVHFGAAVHAVKFQGVADSTTTAFTVIGGAY